MPFIKPMLAQPSDKATQPSLTSADHAYEPKYDGIRCIADVTPTSCKLYARSGADKTQSFPDIAEACVALAMETGASFTLDGEIIAVDEDGRAASFQKIQTRMHVTTHVAKSRAAQACAYAVFDILEQNGVDYLKPVSQVWAFRRARLNELLAAGKFTDPKGTLRPGVVSLRDGTALHEQAMAEGWEGLIVKRMLSRYLPGKRCADWVKVKFKFRQEFVVCGYTEPRRSRSLIGALILGVYDAGKLTYVGRAGTGFKEAELERVHALLAPLVTAKHPFAGKAPKVPSDTTANWLTPKYLAEIEYCEATSAELEEGQSIRFPVYKGLRDDKDPKDVVWENRPSFNQ